MLTISLVAVLVGLGLYAVVRRALSRSPPGPVGVPGLGLLPLFLWRAATDPRHRMYSLLQELWHKYGDVVSFKMGTQEILLISGYETIREAFVTNPDMLVGRANTNFHTFVGKKSGIIGSEGALWLEHRRFALRVLKDLGFGRNASETQIQEEAAHVMSFLRLKDGQKVDTKDFISKPVANVISRFIFSDFSSYDNPEFIEFLTKLSSITNQELAGVLTAFYRFIPVEAILAVSSTSKKQFEAVTWMEDFSRQKIELIRSKYNVSDEPSNYVESYIQEQTKKAADVGTFTDFQLMKTIFELYIAGVDTSSNTLRWCVLYAAINPELQDRCHAEITAKIGKRQVTMKDKKELHYCQAFLDEAQRLCTLVPNSVDHRAIEDTQFRGYHISSDAMIFTNLYGLHHDERLFPNPNTFDPTRFLTPEGLYKPSEYLHQFGIGKRSCLGEVLARMELFLFFVTFMQHFRFEPDTWSPEQLEQILLGSEGVVHPPMDHLLTVKNRDSGQL